MEPEKPAYRRSWTRIRNFRAEYSYRQLVRQHDLSGVPTVLVRQFAAVSVRVHQLDRQIANIERHTPLVTDMDDAVYTRWCFLVGEFRRYVDSQAKLAKAVFAERQGASNRSRRADGAVRWSRDRRARQISPVKHFA
jgi:hypothetical protein